MTELYANMKLALKIFGLHWSEMSMVEVELHEGKISFKYDGKEYWVRGQVMGKTEVSDCSNDEYCRTFKL